jgi:hypothetical protein
LLNAIAHLAGSVDGLPRDVSARLSQRSPQARDARNIEGASAESMTRSAAATVIVDEIKHLPGDTGGSCDDGLVLPDSTLNVTGSGAWWTTRFDNTAHRAKQPHGGPTVE